MLFSPTDPALYLITQRDLSSASLPGEVAAYRRAAQEVLRWARTFLCEPNDALGREGPVCPYAEYALGSELFFVTIHARPRPTFAEVAALVRAYRDWFLHLEPVDGKDAEHKAILILFPTLVRPEVPGIVDAVQAALKPEFVARGLMVGQFHADCDEGGLWNPMFRPLRSTVPLLAIRAMVRTDAPFLMRDPRLFAMYLRRFGRDVPTRLRATVRRAALELGLEYSDV